MRHAASCQHVKRFAECYQPTLFEDGQSITGQRLNHHLQDCHLMVDIQVIGRLLVQ